MASPQRVLVTGNAGYVGAVMVPILVEAGHEVTGLDTGYFEGCDLAPQRASVPTIHKDLRAVEAPDLQGFDAVIHLAGLCNDPLGNLNPELTAEINYRASLRLALLARDAGVTRFIYSSSCSLYGACGADRALDETAPMRPLTAYAQSKVRTEEDVSKLAGPDFIPVFMRNATAYGVSPRLRADLVLNNLTGWAFTTGKVRLMSDGTAWRPLVHVEDIARAFLAVLVAPADRVRGEAFNVGADSENYRITDLAKLVAQAIPGCRVEISGGASRDLRSYRVSFAKLNRLLPQVGMRWNARLGVEELIRAYSEFRLDTETFLGRRFTRLLQLQHLLDAGRLDQDLRWRADDTPLSSRPADSSIQ